MESAPYSNTHNIPTAENPPQEGTGIHPNGSSFTQNNAFSLNGRGLFFVLKSYQLRLFLYSIHIVLIYFLYTSYIRYMNTI